MADNHPAGRDPAALRNTLDVQINPATEEKQDTIIARLAASTGLVQSAYDYYAITRNSSDFITLVVFKTGGSGGSTVATITLVRNGNGFITSVTKT